MKAIILAAGQGTRLKDLTKHTPKCIIKLGGRTILEYQVKILKDYGIEDIFLVIGTKGDVWNQEAYEICNSFLYNRLWMCQEGYRWVAVLSKR